MHTHRSICSTIELQLFNDKDAMTNRVDFVAVCVLVLALFVWQSRGSLYGYSLRAASETFYTSCAYTRCNGSGYCTRESNFTQCGNCSNPNACRFDCIQCPSPKSCYHNHSCNCPSPWYGNVSTPQACNQKICPSVCPRNLGGFCNSSGYCACRSGVPPGGGCLGSCSPNSCVASTLCTASTPGSEGVCQCQYHGVPAGNACDTRCDAVDEVTSCPNGDYCLPPSLGVVNGTCTTCPVLDNAQTGCASAVACPNHGCTNWTTCAELTNNTCGCTPWTGSGIQSCNYGSCPGQCGGVTCTAGTVSNCTTCAQVPGYAGPVCVGCLLAIQAIAAWVELTASNVSCSAALPYYPYSLPSFGPYYEVAELICLGYAPVWPIPSQFIPYATIAGAQQILVCQCYPTDLLPYPVGAPCWIGSCGDACITPSSCSGPWSSGSCACPANGTITSGACNDTVCPGACTAGYACGPGGTCVPCGGLNQPCCLSPASQCTSPAMSCNGGFCTCNPTWPGDSDSSYSCSPDCLNQCGTPVCASPPQYGNTSCYTCAPVDSPYSLCSFAAECVAAVTSMFTLPQSSCSAAVAASPIGLYTPSLEAACLWETVTSWPPDESIWPIYAGIACAQTLQGPCQVLSPAIVDALCLVGCDSACVVGFVCTAIDGSGSGAGQCEEA